MLLILAMASEKTVRRTTGVDGTGALEGDGREGGCVRVGERSFAIMMCLEKAAA
jgi:hypothetical protein